MFHIIHLHGESCLQGIDEATRLSCCSCYYCPSGCLLHIQRQLQVVNTADSIICLELISEKCTFSFDASRCDPQTGFEKRILSRHLSAHSTSLDALPSRLPLQALALAGLPMATHELLARCLDAARAAKVPSHA